MVTIDLADRMSSISIPFVYVIGWSHLQTWYIGVRHAKGCSPIDLWTSYFTSSRQVQWFRQEFGEPDVFDIVCTGSRSEVLLVEEQIILTFSLHRDNQWLNKCAGGHKFNNTGASDKTRAKMRESAANRKRISSDAREHLSDITTKAWADPQGSLRNRKPAANITPVLEKPVKAWGEVKKLGDWLLVYSHITPHQFNVRINQGWSVEDALSRPVRPRRSSK